MSDYLSTMMTLIGTLDELEEIQQFVNRIRPLASLNQETQLALDRRQTEIDRKREFVKMIMADISLRN